MFMFMVIFFLNLTTFLKTSLRVMQIYHPCNLLGQYIICRYLCL
jgi:hypothetical protein